MNKNELPSFLEKRKILFSKTMPAEEVDAYGQMFLDEDRTNQALDFFEKTGNKEKIRRVADKAFDAGDVSAWVRAKRLLDEQPTPEMWEGAAKQAMQFGKEYFAVWAFDQAGKKEQADKIRGEWLRIKREEEKEKGKKEEKKEEKEKE